MLAAAAALSPTKKPVDPPFSPIPDDPDLTQSEGEGGEGSDKKKKKKKKKKKPKLDANLSDYYYEKMSKDRTESHVLEELDTANVDVTEDKDEEEEERRRLEAEELAAARDAFKNPPKQTTRHEDGRARVLCVIKTSWSVEFVHLLHYLVFLALVCTVTLGRPTIQRYWVHEGLHDALVDDFNVRKMTVPYEQINTKEQYFLWLRHTFVPTIFPGLTSSRYNGTAGSNDFETKIAHDMGYRLGTVRLRQLRVEEDSCAVPERFQRAITRCYSKFSKELEEMDEVFMGQEWKSEKEMNSGNFYSHMSKQTYEGSGYEFYLDISSSGDAETWRTLYDATWVDFGTRMVSLDFTIYNPSIDMLVWGSHVTEFMPSGDVIPTFHYRIFDEWKYLRVWKGEDDDAKTWTLLVVEMLMYFYAITYLWEEIREMFYWGAKNYFSSIMNITELFNLAVFFNAALFRYLAFEKLGEIEGTFADDNSFVDIRTFGTYSQVALNLLACNALISFCKLFKYLHFHRGITQFADTIGEACIDITVFIVIMLVVIISFALSFHIAFGHVSRSYMDFPEALFTLFKSTMGQFTIREIQTVNSSGRYLGPFLFISFIVVNIFVIMSMLYAMVHLSFKHVRDEQLSQELHPENSPIVQDLTRILSFFLRVIQKIPGVPQKEFTDQAHIRRRKRIALWLSGESELVRRSREKRRREKEKELALLDEDARRKREEGEDDEVKPLVKNPRKDLLKKLVHVETRQRQMLKSLEDLSRTVRAQTFNAISKQMEDIVNEK